MLHQMKLWNRDLGGSLLNPEIIVCDFELAKIHVLWHKFPSTTARLGSFSLLTEYYLCSSGHSMQCEYVNPDRGELKKFSVCSTTWSCHMFWPPFIRFPQRSSWLGRRHWETHIWNRTTWGRKRAVPARYPLYLWNRFHATWHGLPRICFLTEVCDNCFKKMIWNHHPSLFTQQEKFFKERWDTKHIIMEMEAETRVQEP
jgi:hypothetical protein